MILTSRAAERLYRLVTDTPTLEFIDKALPFIMSSGADPDRITAIGHWLATETPDRSAAKFGIALLGMMDPVDVATLQLLGTHDEFTLYAAVALRNSSAGDGALFVASSEGALSPPPSMSSPCDAGGWSSTGTRHTQWVGLDGVHRRVTRGPPEVIATPESTPSVRAGERQ